MFSGTQRTGSDYTTKHKERATGILSQCNYGFQRYDMSDQREQLQIQADKLKEIRAELGVSRKAFSEYIGIPLRNLEEWEAGRRKMPEYLLRMMTYYIKISRCLEANGIREEIERQAFDEPK